MNTYSHGANVSEFARSIGAEESEIIDFSSNINFVKPSVAMPENLEFLTAYNSDGYAALKTAISAKYGINPENIELYNGASAAIFSLFAHLKPKSVTLHAPIYSEHKKAAKLVGADICESGELSVWVNPSTPDGVLRQIMPHGQTIIDESFLDFTDGASLMGEAENNKALYIIKSLTKYYGAAGVRVGFIASHRKNIGKIRATEPLWKLSSFDAYYMTQALNDGGFDERSRAQNNANKELLRATLVQSGLFEMVYEGKANFLLAKLRDINAEILQTHLAKHKILVRNCANFDTLDDSYVRFAVKDMLSIETLREALCDL
ncbi:MAG: aminotransferase class I/II-fold pyridoxal phosphate-dependent enzyme [Campylobacterales bacterium]